MIALSVCGGGRNSELRNKGDRSIEYVVESSIQPMRARDLETLTVPATGRRLERGASV